MGSGLVGGTFDLLPGGVNTVIVFIASLVGIAAIGLGTTLWLKNNEVKHARESARKIISAGKIDDINLFHKAYNTLARAKYDRESAEILERLRTLLIQTKIIK